MSKGRNKQDAQRLAIHSDLGCYDHLPDGFVFQKDEGSGAESELDVWAEEELPF